MMLMHSRASAGIAAVSLALLLQGRTPAWAVVLLAALAGSLLFGST